MSKQEGAQRPRRRRGAIVTLLIGVLLVVTMPLLGAIGALFSGLGGAIAASGSPVAVGPNANVIDVREGREVRLLVPIDARAPHLTACEVPSPSGMEVGLSELPRVEATEQRFGEDSYFAFARFQTLERGDYVIDCSAAQAVVVASAKGTGLWLQPLIWLGIAAIGTVLGATLLVIGIVRFVRANRHNRELKRSADTRMPNPVADAGPAAESEAAADDDVPNPEARS